MKGACPAIGRSEDVLITRDRELRAQRPVLTNCLDSSLIKQVSFFVLSFSHELMVPLSKMYKSACFGHIFSSLIYETSVCMTSNLIFFLVICLTSIKFWDHPEEPRRVQEKEKILPLTVGIARILTSLAGHYLPEAAAAGRPWDLWQVLAEGENHVSLPGLYLQGPMQMRVVRALSLFLNLD